MAGKVVFDTERCKGCEICVLVCPRKLLSLARERNKLGYRPARITDEGKCTGCALCAQMCPDCVIQVYRDAARGAGGRDGNQGEHKI